MQPVSWTRPASSKSSSTDSKTATTKKTRAQFNTTASKSGRCSPETDCSKRVSLDTSHLSDSKPPKLKRVSSAHGTVRKSASRATTGVDSGYYDHDELTSQSPKQTKLAWTKPAAETSHVTKTVDRTLSTSFSVSESHQEDTASPADSTTPTTQDSREYDAITLSVLRIHFPPATTPTLGLPRPALPPESQAQRYYNLVENAISDQMVAPLSKEWRKKTHDFLPKNLRNLYKETLNILDEVRILGI